MIEFFQGNYIYPLIFKAFEDYKEIKLFFKSKKINIKKYEDLLENRNSFFKILGEEFGNKYSNTEEYLTNEALNKIIIIFKNNTQLEFKY